MLIISIFLLRFLHLYIGRENNNTEEKGIDQGKHLKSLRK